MIYIKMSSLTGSQFINLYPNTLFWKLTNETETHHGLVYKTGLTTDKKPFRRDLKCDGGIYFCSDDQLHLWIRHFMGKMKYIRSVMIPTTATISVEGNKFKTNKIILSERMDIWSDYDSIVKAGSANNYFQLVNPKVQTYAMCLDAVKWYGFNLRFVREDLQTDELCMESVKCYGKALQWVRFDLITKLMCETAVDNNKWAFEWVPYRFQDGTMCMIIIQFYGSLLRFVREDFQTEPMGAIVVRNWGLALEAVRPDLQTVEMCEEAIDYRCYALQFVRKDLQYDNMCIGVLYSCIRMLETIKHRSQSGVELVQKIENAPSWIRDDIQLKPMCIDAIKIFQIILTDKKSLLGMDENEFQKVDI